MTNVRPASSFVRSSSRSAALTGARLTALLALALCAAGVVACAEQRKAPPSTEVKAALPAPNAPSQVFSKAELIARGEELVRLGGCGDCHTPMLFDPKLGMPVPQAHLALSGHPEGAPKPSAKPGATDQAVIGPTFTSFTAPFGTVYAANLTPDSDTGLGDWTLEDFIASMRQGRHQGNGRILLPPMPWQNLSQQPRANLEAMFAYLQSIKPIKNKVPQPEVPQEAINAIAKSYELARNAEAKL